MYLLTSFFSSRFLSIPGSFMCTSSLHGFRRDKIADLICVQHSDIVCELHPNQLYYYKSNHICIEFNHFVTIFHSHVYRVFHCVH